MDEAVVPVLDVENAARAVEWYGRLGFDKEWEHQFELGIPVDEDGLAGRECDLVDPEGNRLRVATPRSG